MPDHPDDEGPTADTSDGAPGARPADLGPAYATAWRAWARADAPDWDVALDDGIDEA